MLTLHREHFGGFTVRHFPDKLVRRHGFGYTWTKLRLKEAGLVARAPRRSADRKERPRRPLTGMLLPQDGAHHRDHQRKGFRLRAARVVEQQLVRRMVADHGGPSASCPRRRPGAERIRAALAPVRPFRTSPKLLAGGDVVSDRKLAAAREIISHPQRTRAGPTDARRSAGFPLPDGAQLAPYAQARKPA